MSAVASAPARALVFIGFMGSGKSTAAAQVARALAVHARDSDQLLEERFGHSIAQEFTTNGEAAFREREEALVLDLLEDAGPGSVLALGGGSVLSERVRAAMGKHLVVFLDIDAQGAWKRVREGKLERPLAGSEADFLELHAKRQPLYEELADASLPAAQGGVAERALPALCTLSQMPEGVRMLWASAASGAYPVLVGRGIIAEEGPSRALSAWLLASGASPDRAAPARLFCVSDRTVAALYGKRLGELAATVLISPGEEHKTLASAEHIWRELARTGMSRADRLIALGGGVVGDLAGFCAATYQRGVPVVHVPTTVVAQVDSAYGGKTGVDLPEAKNYVGAYHQPAAVLADPDTLESLPKREFNAGWVEVLKTALIAGGGLWRAVVAGAPLSTPIIYDCARTKLAIVAEDERDAGRRQVLNLGHTIGHAIEAATGYGRYRHGEAVGLGLLVALELSGQRELHDQVRALLEEHELPVRVQGASATDILEAAALDKKRLSRSERDGLGPALVLVDAPGVVKYGCEVPEQELRHAVEGLLSG